MPRASPSRVSNRPLVKPRKPHRLGDIGYAILSLLLVILPALFYASQRDRLLQTRRQLTRAQQQLVELEGRRQQLVLERALHLDPRRIRDRAETLTGLQQLRAEQFVYLARSHPSPLSDRPLAGPPGRSDGNP